VLETKAWKENHILLTVHTFLLLNYWPCFDEIWYWGQG
jgi:hypothetical protein